MTIVGVALLAVGVALCVVAYGEGKCQKALSDIAKRDSARRELRGYQPISDGRPVKPPPKSF